MCRGKGITYKMPNQDPIPRSPVKLEPSDFFSIFTLCVNQPWIQRKQGELSVLIEQCADLAEQNLICDLLHRFRFINSTILEDKLEEATTFVLSEWQATPKNTLITALSNSDHPESVGVILWGAKSYFQKTPGWKNKHFPDSLPKAAHAAVDGNHIIIFDDFVGSGSKIERLIIWFRKKIDELKTTDVKISVYVLFAMDESKPILEALGCEYKVGEWLQKGISDHFSGTERDEAIQRMVCLENKLKVNPEFSLGFEKSETLFALEMGRAPNNVFPVFWWHKNDIKNYKPMFRR